MEEQKYFLDDRINIPDDIKQISSEKLKAEIQKFEQEMKEKKKTA